MTGPSILPPGHLVPPIGQVVGTVTLRLRWGGRFEMESDVQDPAILIEMLRKTADAIEREANAGPGTVVVEGRKATFLQDAGPPGRV